MVIWIIGLSGSGKTFLSKEILKSLDKKKEFLHIDGDTFRKHFSRDLKYTYFDRQKNAERISKIVKVLDDTGANIVVSVLSNYKKWLLWNRKNIKKYFEIYIKVNKAQLFKRNKKNLYLGNKKNVVGKDIKFSQPTHSDVVFLNKFKKKDTKYFVKKVLVKIKKI